MLAVRDYEFYNAEIESLKSQVNLMTHYINQLECQYAERTRQLEASLEEQIAINQQLRLQMMNLEQELSAGVLQQKLVYADQLEHLIGEIQNLTSILKLKSNKIAELEQVNRMVNQQLDDLQALNYQNEHQASQVEANQKQIEFLKQEKNELHKKYNDSQILVQKLSVDLQCASNQISETQKQIQLQEQIREEISKAQIAHQEQFIKLLQKEINDLKANK